MSSNSLLLMAYSLSFRNLPMNRQQLQLPRAAISKLQLMILVTMLQQSNKSRISLLPPNSSHSSCSWLLGFMLSRTRQQQIARSASLILSLNVSIILRANPLSGPPVSSSLSSSEQASISQLTMESYSCRLRTSTSSSLCWSEFMLARRVQDRVPQMSPSSSCITSSTFSGPSSQLLLISERVDRLNDLASSLATRQASMADSKGGLKRSSMKAALSLPTIFQRRVSVGESWVRRGSMRCRRPQLKMGRQQLSSMPYLKLSLSCAPRISFKAATIIPAILAPIATWLCRSSNWFMPSSTSRWKPINSAPSCLSEAVASLLRKPSAQEAWCCLEQKAAASLTRFYTLKRMAESTSRTGAWALLSSWQSASSLGVRSQLRRLCLRIQPLRMQLQAMMCRSSWGDRSSSMISSRWPLLSTSRSSSSFKQAVLLSSWSCEVAAANSTSLSELNLIYSYKQQD